MSEVDDEPKDRSDIENLNFESVDVATLIKADYESGIERVSTLESKLDQVHSALGHVHTMEGAVEDIKKECNINSLEKLSPPVDSRYVQLGQRIFTKLNDEDTLLTASDKPSSWTDDFEVYSEKIISEYQRLQRLEQKYNKLSELEEQLEEYPGDNAEEAMKILKNRQEEFKHAKHLLELKEGECSVCGVEWENLLEDRQTEVKQQIEKYRNKYEESGTDFTAKFVKNQLDSTKERIDSLEDLDSNIKEVKALIKSLEQQDTEELDSLVDKHLTENN